MNETIRKPTIHRLCFATALVAIVLAVGCGAETPADPSSNSPSESKDETSAEASTDGATRTPAEAAMETPDADAPQMVVHHDPNCGCCGKWIEHMEQHGFAVQSVLETDMNVVKRDLGVPENLPSCHTATVDGYVIEGHVPAADVQRLLAERPDAKGLSVPGMPLGSPGMEYNNQRQAYDVVLFDESGDQSVFNHYPERTD